MKYLFVTFSLVLLIIIGCNNNQESSIAPDVIPPATITTLAVTGNNGDEITLEWEAPGDDGMIGSAAVYDLRYSTTLLTENSWAEAIPVDNLPVPQPAGSSELFTINELVFSDYFFAIKAGDEADNWSEISTVPTASVGPTVVSGMVHIPSGSFMMGDGVALCGSSRRQVTLTHDYYLGMYEVTNLDYLTALQWAYENGYVRVDGDKVFDATLISVPRLLEMDSSICEIAWNGTRFTHHDAGYGSNPHHPVKNVSWFGATRYCDWRSLMEGLTPAYQTDYRSCNTDQPYTAEGYRLPTDAEWEYAARYNNNRIYPWGSSPPEVSRVNYESNWTEPVGTYTSAPAILHLFDLSGNVWEWCDDWHSCDLGPDALIDPVAGENSSNRRLIRGGSWSDSDLYLRASGRNISYPSDCKPTIGFRVARSVPLP